MVTSSSSSSWNSNVCIHRYVDCWIPLVQKQQQQHEEVRLIPPPDIAWLWHCHRLAPARYTAYVMKRFGRVLEADPPFVFQEEEDDDDDDEQTHRDQHNNNHHLPKLGGGIIEEERGAIAAAAGRTQSLWNEMFPDEIFFLPLHNNDDDDDDHKNEPSSSSSLSPSLCYRSSSSSCQCCHRTNVTSSSLLDGFDLMASAECQKDFLWQVSGPRFGDVDFLRQGVDRYVRFLRLSPRRRIGDPPPAPAPRSDVPDRSDVAHAHLGRRRRILPHGLCAHPWRLLTPRRFAP